MRFTFFSKQCTSKVIKEDEKQTQERWSLSLLRGVCWKMLLLHFRYAHPSSRDWFCNSVWNKNLKSFLPDHNIIFIIRFFYFSETIVAILISFFLTLFWCGVVFACNSSVPGGCYEILIEGNEWLSSASFYVFATEKFWKSFSRLPGDLSSFLQKIFISFVSLGYFRGFFCLPSVLLLITLNRMPLNAQILE